MRSISGVIADAILLVHFAIVLFIVGGLLAVWLGAALGWQWIRNPWFRYAHLGAIVTLSRPLTEIGIWVRALLFYRAPEWVFTVAYVAWALATLATLRLVPPRRKAG